jgi:hypothetical protein
MVLYKPERSKVACISTYKKQLTLYATTSQLFLADGGSCDFQRQRIL